MHEGTDFGVIPGTGTQKTLLKPGAEKLLEVYGYFFEIEMTQRNECWEPSKLFFRYEFKVRIFSKRSGNLVGEGMGSCNSMEAKYRWRAAERSCPKCTKAAIIKGKREFGGGWLCFARKGGCGAKFRDGDPAIEGQTVGKVENPDLADMCNTVLKIGIKRALVAATLAVTRSSDLFQVDDDEDDVTTGINEQPQGTPRPSNGAAGAGSAPGGAPESSRSTPAQNGGHSIRVRGKSIETAGITASTYLRLEGVVDAYDKANGAEAATQILAAVAVGKTALADLTEEQAQAAVSALSAAK